MENKSGHISDVDLDKLLNETFLELDFDGDATNKDVLRVVAKHALQPPAFFALPRTYRLDLLFLITSAIVCLISVYRLFHPEWNYDSTNSKVVPRINIVSQQEPATVLASNYISEASTNHLSTQSSNHTTEAEVAQARKNRSSKSHKKSTLTQTPDSIPSENTRVSNHAAINNEPPMEVLSHASQDTVAAAVSTRTSSALPASPPRKVTAAKQSSGEAVSRKVKKNRWWNKLFRSKKGGTFIMKGGKYRKSGRT